MSELIRFGKSSRFSSMVPTLGQGALVDGEIDTVVEVGGGKVGGTVGASVIGEVSGGAVVSVPTEVSGIKLVEPGTEVVPDDEPPPAHPLSRTTTTKAAYTGRFDTTISILQLSMSQGLS